MILVAGVSASVLIQTMNSLENQALKTGSETISDISSGLRVTRVNGYTNNSKISQLAIFLKTIAGSNSIDLGETYISISDSNNQAILNYDTNCFKNDIQNGLFQTLNSSNLSSSTFGIIVVRDLDSSLSSQGPYINDNDLVVLMVNTTECFSGIDTRANIFGNVVPEQGVKGVISFTTPSALIDRIIELQP
jgi:flagellin FlaB